MPHIGYKNMLPDILNWRRHIDVDVDLDVDVELPDFELSDFELPDIEVLKVVEETGKLILSEEGNKDLQDPCITHSRSESQWPNSNI